VVGYWRPLLAMLDHMVAERLLRAEHRDTLLVERDAGALLDALEGYQHRAADKWLDRRAAEA
jgi:predicted Rossmann-fold nucleotide-binding protein